MVSQREIRMNTPSRISQERIEKSVSVISSEFLNSPQYICESLSAELGARVLVKIETANPIRSFKGRGAELYMSKMTAGTEVVCASAGNFGQAMAYAARRRGIRVSVVAARNANPLKIERMKSLGADVILAGEDFDSARGFCLLNAVHGLSSTVWTSKPSKVRAPLGLSYRVCTSNWMYCLWHWATGPCSMALRMS